MQSHTYPKLLEPKWVDTEKKKTNNSKENKNIMVLAQKQTGRPMDSNRRPRHKPTYLQQTYLWQRSPKHTMEERKSLQQMLLGKLGIHL
jgi:hypothetical protein